MYGEEDRRVVVGPFDPAAALEDTLTASGQRLCRRRAQGHNEAGPDKLSFEVQPPFASRDLT